jgi:hypothetical protein
MPLIPSQLLLDLASPSGFGPAQGSYLSASAFAMMVFGLMASKKRFAQTFGGLKSPVEVMLKPLIENPHQTFRLGKRRRQETRDVITLMWQPALFIEQHSRIGPCQKEEKDADRKSEVCAGIISVRALRTELGTRRNLFPISCPVGVSKGSGSLAIETKGRNRPGRACRHRQGYSYPA